MTANDGCEGMKGRVTMSKKCTHCGSRSGDRRDNCWCCGRLLPAKEKHWHAPRLDVPDDAPIIPDAGLVLPSERGKRRANA